MEIFLLFVVIILMVFFETSRSSKINALERKLTSLEAYLKNYPLHSLKKRLLQKNP